MYKGLTRRIDNLGRITIPKEVRNSLNINDGDLMEIGTQGREITIKKHYPLDNLDDYFDDISVVLNVVAMHNGLSEQQCEKLGNKISELKDVFYEFLI